MGHFKIKKHDTFIDMTPMSDVMVLLLTFFMLTSTFIKPEPVKVNTPGSVSEIAIPDKNILTILVEKNGRIYMSMDKKADMMATMDLMNEKYSLGLSPKQVSKFSELPAFSLPVEQLAALLKKGTDNADIEAYMSGAENKGIPCDSTDNQFKDWVSCAVEANPDMRIAIKADASTSYKVVKGVMNSLQDIKQNRYNLITNLKKEQAVDE
jgi:biopolymer transport protein ExbD